MTSYDIQNAILRGETPLALPPEVRDSQLIREAVHALVTAPAPGICCGRCGSTWGEHTVKQSDMSIPECYMYIYMYIIYTSHNSNDIYIYI